MENNNNLKVLLVDDDAICLSTHELMLEKYGCQVETAKCSLAAIEAVNNTNFDFVIMDVGLPDIPGFEAIAIIRKMETSGKQIPIIVLTGYEDGITPQLCMNAGANTVLIKPIKPDELYAAIKQHVKAKK